MRSDPETEVDPQVLLLRVARGDQAAFELLFASVASAVLGVTRRVLRDPEQAQEVSQEVMVEVWRTATRFDPERGSAMTWVLTMAHRRAVDRVRSAQAATDREHKVARREHLTPFDEVAEAVEVNLERQQVRAALGRLTQVQREAIELAYYGGYTQREVAAVLDLPLGTVKTRMRDGLIRLRDALGVQS